MRSIFLALLFAVVAVSFLAPQTAEASSEAPFYKALREAREAASAPFDSAFGLAQGERAGDPRGPVEDPADWIAVVGIACYAIIPVVLVVVLGVVAYHVYLNQTDAALLSARSDGVVRGSRPPAGLVLLRF